MQTSTGIEILKVENEKHRISNTILQTVTYHFDGTEISYEVIFGIQTPHPLNTPFTTDNWEFLIQDGENSVCYLKKDCPIDIAAEVYEKLKNR
jgi:hypothetical protein